MDKVSLWGKTGWLKRLKLAESSNTTARTAGQNKESPISLCRDGWLSFAVGMMLCGLKGGLNGPQLAATAVFSTTHASQETCWNVNSHDTRKRKWQMDNGVQRYQLVKTTHLTACLRGIEQVWFSSLVTCRSHTVCGWNKVESLQCDLDTWHSQVNES